jgi:hypothetical protein
MAAEGGWTLSDHLRSTETLQVLNSEKWNFVVLQEQSQIPAGEQVRAQAMYPAARELVQKIKTMELRPFSSSPGRIATGGPNME